MAKLLKIVSRIIGGILEWVLLVLIIFVFAVRTSKVQTLLAELATNYLSKELKTELHIDKVDFIFFDRLALDGVFVRDLKGDTLASLGSIDVKLKLIDLKTSRISLQHVGIKNGKIGINRDSLTGDYNYGFIADYFASDSPKAKKKPPVITIAEFDLENIDLDYHDNRKGYSPYGMDYDHLILKDVNLRANTIKVDGNEVDLNLVQLDAKEMRSGFVLRRLMADCHIGYKGILLSNVKLNTAKSRLYANRLNLRMSGLEDVHTFEDSVSFDIYIDSSAVDMSDVSVFAPALKGMYQKVYLQAGLTQKVKNLKLSNIDLRTGLRTIIRGDLLLPDFDSLDGSFLKENVQYAYISLEDLEAMRLPDGGKQKFLSFEPMIKRLGYFEVKQLNVTGYWSQFVLSGKQMGTQMGTVHLDNGLLFTELKEGGYSFERSASSDYDVYIDSFQLGKFIDDPLFGNVAGSLFLNGVVGQKDIIRLDKLSGVISSAYFKEYTYSNIEVSEGSFINNIFDAKVVVNDPHLQLVFDGSINVNKRQHFDFNVAITKADLGMLNFVKNDSASLVATFDVNVKGTGLSDYNGSINLDHLVYKEAGKTISVPALSLTATRGASDVFTIVSDVANVELTGKINPKTISTSINNMLVPYLPAYFSYQQLPRGYTDNNFFDLTVHVNKAEEILSVFLPELTIANGSEVIVHYSAPQKEATVDITSGQITYGNMVVKDLKLNESTLNNVAKLELNAGYFELNDSLYITNVDVGIEGTDNQFNTLAKWKELKGDSASFAWKTTFSADNVISVDLKPSYFTIKGQAWEIMNSAKLSYSDKRVSIEHLVLEREEQFIAVNGVLSSNPEDELVVDLNALQLADFSAFIDPGLGISGNVSGKVKIATPFTAFRINGDVNVKDLVVSKEPVGDVYLNGMWDAENERVSMKGDLKYMQNETFDFSGYYYPYKKDNNLDFDLEFRGMNLQFANAFMDPKVVSDIRGNLKGNIRLTGSTESPMIDGTLKLDNGSVRITLLGAMFRLNGPIEFNGKENAFYLNNLPIKDEEGNNAYLTGSINHTNFKNWNVDIGINIEDDFSRLDSRGNPRRIERFLVLNTTYEEGQVFYGRAYVTGTANIFVTEENVEIAVNLQTEKGTTIELPMYGNSEIAEDDFITFIKNGQEIPEEEEIDLSSVELDLNFRVTPDAKVKLIFNEKTGDEITASGNGDLTIRVDNVGDVTMDGQYIIKDGIYNFVLGPIKQNFFIEQGGSITFTGDPANANLDLRTYLKVNANINEVVLDVIENNGGGGSANNQEVYCVLALSSTLSTPVITLDIQAPKASESGKAILSRIRSDKDELQKQFFSLVLFKKFAPLGGGSAAGTGGLADVLTTQINSVLSQMSRDVKLNVAYDADATYGDSYEFGVSKSFGQRDNIILKGSFGVANSTSGSSTPVANQSQNTLIGDMSLEYLINDEGTFRVNIFNESNANRVIQTSTNAQFTQGIGLHYQEDFNTVKDFQMIQFVLDIFRKEKRVKITSRRKEVPVNDPPPTPEPIVDPKGNTSDPDPQPKLKKE